MCKDCIGFLQTSFVSNEDFDFFDSVLLSSKDIFSFISPLHKGEVGAVVAYECACCKDKWFLSVPDQAHRGFFLTEFRYLEKEKKRKAKRKALLITAIILVIIAIAILAQLT
jgi:hypothetical protein